MSFDEGRLPLERAFQWERTRPDALYLTQPLGAGRIDRFSWQRVMSEARRMANHIRSFGFPPGSQIAILSKNCAHYIISDLAIWMAGHASVGLFPTLTAKSVRQLLDHSEARLLFVGRLDTWAEAQAGVPPGMPCISYPLSPPTSYPTWNDIVARTAPIEGTPTRPADDLAVIVYTSGSAGEPKGVMHSFRTMSTVANILIDTFHVDSTWRMLSYLPLAHVSDRLFSGCMSMIAGLQVFFCESLDTFLEDLKRARPTFFVSVPRLWTKFQQGVTAKIPEKKLQRMLRIPLLSGYVKRKILRGLGLDQVKLAAIGAAPATPELIQWYRDLGLELLEGYGMSENFAMSHMSVPGKTRRGYVGNVYPGVECRIGPDGEVLVKSPGTMLGYFKEPEMTRNAFTPDGFLKTGDRGELDELQRLKITGRVKELFKTSKGKYVAPAPLENVLNRCEYVEQSCVSGVGRPQPFAMILVAEQVAGRLSDPKVRREVHDALAEALQQTNAAAETYERLQFLVVVKDRWTIDNGLLTPTLKMKRSLVEQRYAAKHDEWYGAGDPIVWDA